MHDIIITPKRDVLTVESDLFIFCEISDNVSETVQDGCNGRLIGNRMWPIEWHHCQCP